MITDPRFAPKRKDLPWLRRRRLPKAAMPPPPAPPAPPARPNTPTAPTTPSTHADPPLREFIEGHTTHHEHDASSAPAAPASAPASSSLDLDAPRPPARATPPAPAASSSSLDLDAPSATPAPRPSSSSLDLDEPTATPAARPSSSSSLDLDDPPPARPAQPSASAPQRRRRVDQRVRAGERFILTPTDPTVTLTALQSGIGSLAIEAAVSDEVGDLRLGCAYEFDTGTATPLELTMQMTQGSRLAPPHSKRPVLLGGRDRFERISLDLRQCRSLTRLVVYAFSEARRPLNWSGTLIVSTFGGARVEVPLESLQGGQIAVLLSIYRVGGELVLRAEMQALNGDVREASRAYGYDRITWLDDRTPVE